MKHINSYEYSLLRLLQNYANPLAKANGDYHFLLQYFQPTNRQLINANTQRRNLRMKYYNKRNSIARNFGKTQAEVQVDMNRLNFLRARRPRTPSKHR